MNGTTICRLTIVYQLSVKHIYILFILQPFFKQSSYIFRTITQFPQQIEKQNWPEFWSDGSDLKSKFELDPDFRFPLSVVRSDRHLSVIYNMVLTHETEH